MSRLSTALDTFSTAKVTYSINDVDVTYAYSGERWSPIPKKNSKLLNNLGYPEVIFAAANAERIEARVEDFNPRRVKDAPKALRDAAREILGDQRFDSLKVVNVRRGVGAEAFLMFDAASTAKKPVYYSEKNFNLGEICILKLLRQLHTAPNLSLVLIDELELALYPKAQVNLLNYLRRVAGDKNLTIIFSTHSTSIIKTASRNSLSYVERHAKTRQLSFRSVFRRTYWGSSHLRRSARLTLSYL